MDFNLIFSVLIPVGSAIAISLFFKYKLRSKIEKTFEKNRDEALAKLSILLFEYDSKFGYFYEFFEKEFFVLTDNKVEFELKPQQRDRLDQAYKNYKTPIKGIFDEFEDLKYLSDFVGLDILKIIRYYFSTSHNYCQSLSQQMNDIYYLEQRSQSAVNLIVCIKKEGIPKGNLGYFLNEFVSKWENRLGYII